MGNWENQYIQQVNEHSSKILEEKDFAFEKGTLHAFLEHKKQYRDIYLELGSGSGMHLLDLAERSPHALCIGVELRYKRTFRTVEKARSRGIENIFMIRGCAKRAIKLFKKQEIAKLFIHFPDPWEKARWRKHRLVQEPFLSELISLLTPQGEFSFRTDHREYFAEVISLIESLKEQQCPIIETLWSTDNLFESEFGGDSPVSEFESLFVKKKVPIGATVIRKK